MPNNPIAIPHTFASQTGPIPLSQIDDDLSTAYFALNSLSQYSNYFVDTSGAADAITIAVPSGLDPSLVTGLPLQIKVANTNATTSPTLLVNALGAKAIVNADGSSPSVGQFVANGIYEFIYNGTAFQVLSSAESPLINQSKFKPNQESRASTITLTNDADLVFSSLPAGTYKISGFLQFQGSVTGTQGFKFHISIAGSISGNRFINYAGIVNNTNFPPVLSASLASTLIFATIQSSQTDFLNFDVILTTTSAGTIALQWAQNSSSANATILNDRSWMSVQQIA